MIAHRGASGQRPENTLAAYALAVEQRADMIEIDLHRTRDGAVVILHDGELRGLGGAGAVGDASLAEVRALDAGEGQQVPLLDEVLDAFAAVLPFNLAQGQPAGSLSGARGNRRRGGANPGDPGRDALLWIISTHPRQETRPSDLVRQLHTDIR